MRAGATGAETGRNWNDAWSAVARIKWGQGSGEVGAGDTLWIGGGKYSRLDLSYDVPAGFITIARANSGAAECTKVTGWVSTFESPIFIEIVNGLTAGNDYRILFNQRWFVSPAGTGNKNGIDWTNAFSSSAINWDYLHEGDVIFLRGGNYSGLKIKKSGVSEGARITIRAAQDPGFDGVVTINGEVNFASQHYITIDGEVNGARKIRVVGAGIQAGGANYFVCKQLEISTTDIGLAASHGVGGRVSGCFFYDIRQESAMQFNARNYQIAGYDQTLVDNTVIQLNRTATGSGIGPDGIQGCWGLTVSNCLFTNIVGTVEGGQHQDYVQMMANYVTVTGSRFIGSADSCLDYGTFNGQPAHHRIFNNEFILTRGSGIRYYGGGYTFNSMLDVHILNNTFVDHTSGHQWAVSVANIDGGALAVTDVSIQNNLFYNCISPVYIEAAGLATAASYNFDYNLINAGGSGDTAVTVDGSAYTQTHPFDGIPQFVGYAALSEASNLRLSAADTAARDKGVNQSPYFSWDKDSNVRPAGAAWDIGAFEAQP